MAVLGSVLLHPIAFFSLMLVFTFLGLNEFFIISGINDGRKKNILFFVFGVFFYIITGLIGLGYLDIRFAYFLLLMFPLTIVHELFRKNDASWLRIGTYFTGYLYISVPFGLMNALYLVPGIDGYYKGVLLGLFVLVWTSDIFAYLTGSMFGKHRLFERISPKKSWEGSIGGLFFSLIAAYVLSLFLPEINLVNWMIMALIIVVTATLGDLGESLLKRNAGVKDTGKIFPGHGGVLDRFDATIFATPFVFVYVNMI